MLLTLEKDMSPEIAVVVPVKDGFPEIKRLVNTILKQSVRVSKILLIETGSSVELRRYSETVDEIKLVNIDEKDFNHGATRNRALSYINESIVFFTVQDAWFEDGKAIEKLIAPLLEGEVIAVCGQQMVPICKSFNPLEWYNPINEPALRIVHGKEFSELEPTLKAKLCSWDNVCAAYSTEVLKSLPFPEVKFGEDMLWAKLALENGYQIAYEPRSRICHYHHENPDFTFRRAFITHYFRYKNFKVIPVSNTNNRLYIIKAVYRLLKLCGPNFIDIGRWLNYNLNQKRGLNRSRITFVSYLSKGENFLDLEYEKLFSVSPQAPKLWNNDKGR